MSYYLCVLEYIYCTITACNTISIRHTNIIRRTNIISVSLLFTKLNGETSSLTGVHIKKYHQCHSNIRNNPSPNWRENKTIKMVLFKVDLQFHEAFVKPIHGLYDEYIVTIDGFKENNAELLKGHWMEVKSMNCLMETRVVS